MKKNNVGFCCLTYNGMKYLPKFISSIEGIVGRLIFIDTSSTDGTYQYLANLGFEVYNIENNMFNHGLTREYARKILDTDFVVFFTQDIILRFIKDIENLLAPLIEYKCAVSYGRQIPHDNASFFESFPRLFNYPELDNGNQIRSLDDLDEFGMKLFFSSDAFSAYNNRILDSIGGFPEALTHEDYLVAYKLLKNGYKIAYVSSAVVKHSHKYNLIAEFKRHFDAGYIRGIYKELEATTGKTEKEGMAYFKSFIKETIKFNFLLVPYSLLIIMTKYLGFKVGYHSKRLPNKIKFLLSGQPYYWLPNYMGNKKKVGMHL